MSDARILLYDVETAPNLAYVWGKYDQNVLAYAEEWYLLTFAWKWLDEKQINVIGLDDFPDVFKKDPTNDFKLVEKLHSLYSEADVIIGHNSRSFDNKKSKARMLVHGFDPPRPYQEVDTCLVARKYFSFNSNSLKDLATTLGLTAKGDPGGIQTWLSCMAGNDEKAWKTMKRYNKRDVAVLEEVYLKMRPWIEGHPNLALIEESLEECPNCGESEMTRQGLRRSRTMTYQQWKCGACGAWSRTRASEKTEKPKFVN
jgi:ssDNA-binding Zn-finger/Zn-ribbon topoisomerase 1